MTKQRKGSPNAKGGKSTSTRLDPEVEAFAEWFADWWLRRGARLVAGTKKSDPNYLNKRKVETRLPLRWDEESGRLVLDRQRDG